MTFWIRQFENTHLGCGQNTILQAPPPQQVHLQSLGFFKPDAWMGRKAHTLTKHTVFFHWTSEALLFGWSSLCTMHVTLSHCLFLRLVQNQMARRCACEYLYAFTYKYIYIYTYIYSICICVYSIYQCILYMYIVCQYVHMCWSCPIVVVSIYHATSKK